MELCILPDIRMEIPSELRVSPVERSAHATMVAAMAEIDFADKVQQDHFEKAKRNARAAMGAIDFEDKVQRERFVAQLFLKIELLTFEDEAQQEKEALERIKFEQKEKREKEEFDHLERIELEGKDEINIVSSIKKHQERMKSFESDFDQQVAVFDCNNPSFVYSFVPICSNGKSFESSFNKQAFVFDQDNPGPVLMHEANVFDWDNPYPRKDDSKSTFDSIIHLKKHEESPIRIFDCDNPEAIIERIGIFDRDNPRHFDSNSIKRVGVFDHDNPHQSTLKRIGVFDRDNPKAKDTTIFFPFRKMRSFFYLPTIMRSLYL